MKNWLAIVAAIVSLFAATPLYAQTFDGYAWAAAEGYSRGDSPGGHGIAFVGVRVQDLPRDAVLEMSLNTDTLRVGVDNVRLGEGWWAGAQVAGEYGYANLLPDYHRRGELIDGRGFSASWLEGSAHISTRREDHLYVRFESSVRQWYFQRLDSTANALVLPPSTTMLSPRMRITWWDVEPDASHWEWHRPFWRFEGLGFGASFGIDHRADDRRWGNVSTTRNTPETNSGVATQWLGWGIRFARDFRFEIREEAGFMTGADDLTRRQMGGLNPYVVPVAGAPWTAHLADQWVAGTVRQRWAVTDAMEIGARFDAAWANDIDRTGDSDGEEMLGLGVELDWRPGKVWQVDAFVGYSPDTGTWSAAPQISAYLGAGRSF